MSWKFEFDGFEGFVIFEVRIWIEVPGVRVVSAVSKSRTSSVKVIVRVGCSRCCAGDESCDFSGWKVNWKSSSILGASAIVPEKL